MRGSEKWSENHHGLCIPIILTIFLSLLSSNLRPCSLPIPDYTPPVLLATLPPHIRDSLVSQCHKSTSSVKSLDMTELEVPDEQKKQEEHGPEIVLLFLFICLLIGCACRFVLEVSA
eukprot:764124-Hanusia_phi.AAC.5